MNNRTFVCLECRTTKRADPAFTNAVNYRCISCSKPLEMLDKRRRVPKKDDDKSWKELRVYLVKLENKFGPVRTKSGVSKLEKIDRMISLAESRPETTVSEKKIKLLKYQRRVTAKAYDLT